MAKDMKAQIAQLDAAVAEYKLKHGKMPSEEPEPFSVRLQQDNIELIQQTREQRARIAALEADCARLKAALDKYSEDEVCKENARLREDAERYRWLKDRADSVDFEYGPDKKFVMLFAMPHGMRVSGDLDKTIDAARREKT